MVQLDPPTGQRPLFVRRRGGFFEDPFFRDAWEDYSHAVRRIVDRFNHGWLGKQRGGGEGAMGGATPHYHSVYRSLRAARLSYATHSAKFKEEGDVYKLVMDVGEFVGGDVTVRTAGTSVSVRGKVDVSLQNPVIRKFDRSRDKRRKARDGGAVPPLDDSDEGSATSETSTKTLHRRFTLPVDANGEKVHSTLSRDAILTVTIPKRNDVRVIPVTLEDDASASPERGRPRLKRPSTSEPASPVPSKRSQGDGGLPRRGANKAGVRTLEDGCVLNGTMKNTENNQDFAIRNANWKNKKMSAVHGYGIQGNDFEPQRDPEESRCTSNTSVSGVLDGLETSSDITVRRDRTEDVIRLGSNDSSRSRSRRNSKYEEVYEVTLPVCIGGKADTDAPAVASLNNGKDKQTYNIKIHRADDNERKTDTNKENESPKKRKSHAHSNGWDLEAEQTVLHGISNGVDNEGVLGIKADSSDLKGNFEKSTPKTFYHFGDFLNSTDLSKDAMRKQDIKPIQSEKVTLTNENVKKHDAEDLESSVANVLESVRQRQQTECIRDGCNSSENSMSTKSLESLLIGPQCTKSSAPSTTSSYSTSKRVHTLPGSSALILEGNLSRSPKRKISAPTLGADFAGVETKIHRSPKINHRKNSAPSINKSSDVLTRPSYVADGESRKATKKNASNTPPSPDLGKEVNVEHHQSLLEDDVFKDCWRDYSNTLQDVLSRLQELSSELGQTPKFLVSSPTAPIASLPGSAEVTSVPRPAYHYLPTPEVVEDAAASQSVPAAADAKGSSGTAGRVSSPTVGEAVLLESGNTAGMGTRVCSVSCVYSPAVSAGTPNNTANTHQWTDSSLRATPRPDDRDDSLCNKNKSVTRSVQNCISSPRRRPTTLHLDIHQDGPLLRSLRKSSPVEALREHYLNRVCSSVSPMTSASAFPLSTDAHVHYVPVELSSGKARCGDVAMEGGSGGCDGKAPAPPSFDTRQSELTRDSDSISGAAAATPHQKVTGQQDRPYHDSAPSHTSTPRPPTQATPTSGSTCCPTTTARANTSNACSARVLVREAAANVPSYSVSKDVNSSVNKGSRSQGRESSAGVGESVACVGARSDLDGAAVQCSAVRADSPTPTETVGVAVNTTARSLHRPTAPPANIDKVKLSGLYQINNEEIFSSGDSKRDPHKMEPLFSPELSDYTPSSRASGAEASARATGCRSLHYASEAAPHTDHSKTGIAVDAERIIEQTRKLSSTTLNNLDSPTQTAAKCDALYIKKKFNFESSDPRTSSESSVSIDDDSLEEHRNSSNGVTPVLEEIIQGRLSFPIERLRCPASCAGAQSAPKAEQEEQADRDVTVRARPLAAKQTKIQDDDVTATTVQRSRQPLHETRPSQPHSKDGDPTCGLHQTTPHDMGSVFSTGRTRGASQPPTVSTTPSLPSTTRAALRLPVLKERVPDPVPPYVSQRPEPARRYSGFSHVTSDNVRRMRNVWGAHQDKPPARLPPGTPPRSRKPSTSTSAPRTAPPTPGYGGQTAVPTSSFTTRQSGGPDTPQRSSSPSQYGKTTTPAAKADRTDKHTASHSARSRGGNSQAGGSKSASASPSRVSQSPNRHYSRKDERCESPHNPRSASATRIRISPEKIRSTQSTGKTDQKSSSQNAGSPSPTPTRKTFQSHPYNNSEKVSACKGSNTGNISKASSPLSDDNKNNSATSTSSTTHHKCRSSPSRDSLSKTKPTSSRSLTKAQASTASNATTSKPTTNTRPATSSTTLSASSKPRTSKATEDTATSSAHKRIFKRFRDASLRPDSETLCFVEQEDRYRMVLDVAEFVSGEVEVLQDDKVLTVKGSVETHEGEGQSALRTFHRTFSIPQNSKEEDIDSALSEDGFLTIFVPKKRERVIKIELVD